MTAGERRFARVLESQLESDYLCWFEIPVGKRQRYTDFIILHPGRGLLLLEVKDWKLDTIHKIDHSTITLHTASGLKNTQNPIDQVRQCTYHLINSLERDPLLVHHDGQYQGKLVFPYAFGVVLTNITRRQFAESDLPQVIKEHLVICKDEMLESTDPEEFQKCLWDMFPVTFSNLLTPPQIDHIRGHLFPEIVIRQPAQQELFNDAPALLDENEDLLPDIMRIMDLQQEQLARSLGAGHRVIHGVAGSGKTLILGYRCLELAHQMNKPILVLCFNVTLAARLRELMQDRGIAQQVNVRHFHDWCKELLVTYHIKPPPLGDNYVQELVATVVEATAKGQIPKGAYGAIMIDEGHDFEPEWLQLVVDSVDPESESLLLLYDDAQSIYSAKKEMGFSLSSVGIKARGRTTVLRVNYRNTDEIMAFAYHFARDYFKEESKDDEIPLIEPESARRHGPEPVVQIRESLQDEIDYTARCLQSLNNRGMPWSDMCVLYRIRHTGQAIASGLMKYGIPANWLVGKKEKASYKRAENKVTVMTLHSSKGLEFPFVSIVGTNQIPIAKADEASEAKLLYVGMTRATEMLLVTGHGNRGFLGRLVA
jgi:hypothetical protein